MISARMAGYFHRFDKTGVIAPRFFSEKEGSG